jgi:hypothetical protein
MTGPHFAARRPRRLGLWPQAAVLAAALAVAAVPVRATPAPGADAVTGQDPSILCDQAAAEAAARTGVPLSVMTAISLTETGRKRAGAFRPWPWTVNMEGKGEWFTTPDEALSYVYAAYKRGARSFDVGCFQINFKWHGGAFTSLEQMFDPRANALYAADFLRRLHAETGSWSLAAGAYHSRTPEFAERYRTRFDRIHARLGGAPDASDITAAAANTAAFQDTSGIPEIPDIVAAAGGLEPAVPRVNTFPLLRGGAAAGGLGSLVPGDAAGSGSLFAAAGADTPPAADPALPVID